MNDDDVLSRIAWYVASEVACDSNLENKHWFADMLVDAHHRKYINLNSDLDALIVDVDRRLDTPNFTKFG